MPNPEFLGWAPGIPAGRRRRNLPCQLPSRRTAPEPLFQPNGFSSQRRLLRCAPCLGSARGHRRLRSTEREPPLRGARTRRQRVRGTQFLVDNHKILKSIKKLLCRSTKRCGLCSRSYPGTFKVLQVFRGPELLLSFFFSPKKRRNKKKA